MMKYAICSFLIIFCLSYMTCDCEKDPAKPDKALTIEDLLIKNNELTGWTYNGAGWLANNISELTIYIDGAAEIYQRHSFVEAAFQQYGGKIDNGDRLLKLTIYNQSDSENAKATYDDPDIGLIGAIQWEDGAGDEAKYVRNGGLSQVLTFYLDRYFIYLEINYDTDESLNILKQFALAVAGNID